MRALLCFALGSLLSAQTPLLRTLTPLTPDTPAASLRRLDITCAVAGGVAQTTWEATLENGGNRALEAEWTLPLASDQQVVAMALEMGGVWREATLTDRARARRAYEEITRYMRDPAILEREEGAQARLRVAPIPAHGVSRVRVTTRQALRANLEAPGLRLHLPLRVNPAPLSGTFSLRIDGRQCPQLTSTTPLSWTASAAGWQVEMNLAGRSLDDTFECVWSGLAPKTVERWQDRRGPDHFALARVSLPPLPPLPAPKRILLAWDTSASAADRDLARVLAVLEDRLALCPDATVEVRALGAAELERRDFPPAPGRIDAIRALLGSWKAWGGFAWRSLQVRGVDEALLATEGLALDDPKEMSVVGARLCLLAAHAQADVPTLRAALSGQRASVLDLASLSRSEAREVIARPHWRVVGVDGGLGLRSTHPALGATAPLECWVNARLDRLPASLTLRLEAPDGSTFVQPIAWTSEDPVNPAASMRWAEAEWEARDQAHPADRTRLRALALHFGLLTRDTALISLERVEDYARFGIEPPAAWREAWLKKVGTPPTLDSGWDAPASTPAATAEADPDPFEPEGALVEAWEARRWWREGRMPPHRRPAHPQDFCRPQPPLGFPGATDGTLVGTTYPVGMPGGVVGGVAGGVVGGVVGGMPDPRGGQPGDLLESRPRADLLPKDGLPSAWPASQRIHALRIAGEAPGSEACAADAFRRDLQAVQALREQDRNSPIGFARAAHQCHRPAFALQALSELFAPPRGRAVPLAQLQTWGWAASRMGLASDVARWARGELDHEPSEALGWADFFLEGGQEEAARVVLDHALASGQRPEAIPPPPSPGDGPVEVDVPALDAPLLTQMLVLETRLALGRVPPSLKAALKPLAPWPLRVEISWTGDQILPIGLREPSGFLVWAEDPLSPAGTGLAARLPEPRAVFMARSRQNGIYQVETCAPWRPIPRDAWIRIVVWRAFGGASIRREVHWVNLKGRSGHTTLLRISVHP